MSGAAPSTPIAARRRSEAVIDGRPEEREQKREEQGGRAVPSASATGSGLPHRPAPKTLTTTSTSQQSSTPAGGEMVRRYEFCNTTTAGPDVVTNPVRLVVVRVRHRDDNINVHLHTFQRNGGRRIKDGERPETSGTKCVPLRKDWCRLLCPGMISVHELLLAVFLSMAVFSVDSKSLDTKQQQQQQQSQSQQQHHHHQQQQQQHHHHHQHGQTPEQRMWLNPCGYPSPYEITINTPINIDFSKMRDQVNTSLGTMEVSIRNYTKTIFGVPMDRHHTTWESRDEPWIYKDGLRIPKKFRNDIVDTIYMRISYMSLQEATRDFYRLLKDSYRRYIRLAKGIEKMKEDLENVHNKAKYKRYELELLNQVREEVRQSLQQVLCEIFEVLVVIDKKFLFQTLREDHTIDINDSYLDESERKLRDWTIYRELINQLEYIIQYMKALEQRRTHGGNQSSSE
ncbi:uncharacterized protein LOC121597399 [Anopheles merus]|uniref:uncharacterized protein LOC121597399 n=1 Tax=Anopheles merus TaxID=30066 RepID=UPI001BE3F744|nr:uncharacterized protein LOC121597399 [Anopheles merus]XP_041779076.1 uncharacterized protein LOC121597399 [Anopheles merus]